MDYVKKALEKHNSKTKDNPIDYDEYMKSVDWAGCEVAESVLGKWSEATVEPGVFRFQGEVEDDLFDRIAYEIALKELYLYFKRKWEGAVIDNRDWDL